MNDEFRKRRAATVREMAAKADPFTKKRLLDLADRYDEPKRPVTATARVSATAEKQVIHKILE